MHHPEYLGTGNKNKNIEIMFGRLPMTAKAAAMLLVETSLKDPVMVAMVTEEQLTEDNSTLQRTTAEDNSPLQCVPRPLYPSILGVHTVPGPSVGSS